MKSKFEDPSAIKTRRKRWLALAIGIASLVLIAVALGVGLGLGLRNVGYNVSMRSIARLCQLMDMSRAHTTMGRLSTSVTPSIKVHILERM